MELLALIDYTKFLETISIIIAAGVGVIWGVIKFWQSKPKNDNFLSIHNEIHELLTELRVTTKSMRASIIQFHNGEYTMDGISMRKFSVTHESTYKGYTSQVNKLKSSLCSMFIPLLNHVVENKNLVYSTLALPESFVKSFFEDENICNYACLPIKNKGANVGFILIQWHNDFSPRHDEQDLYMKHFDSIRDSIQLQLSQQRN
jgi:hypothetical protein